MANYITAVNQLIASEVARIPNVVLYGENLNKGSHISGLTRNLKVQEGGRIINVGNCEATHCGVGFGLMLSGVSSVLFVKQLDFMLLGIDHFVSTYNFVRCHCEPSLLGSFTIIVIVCDQGYQGPQSSFNALGDICSLARVPGYTVTNNQDTPHVLRTQLGKPGFRFIALSQRLFPTEFLNLETVYVADDSSVFQYTKGNDVTIVCFNFSLPEGHILHGRLLENGVTSDLFSVDHVFPHNWERITQSVAHTRKLVVLDDSKSVNLLCYTLLHEVAKNCPPRQQVVVTRESDIDFGVCPDNLQIDYDAVSSQLLHSD
jgi:pyruvate/2-oxoglutarate/acetoin dehydrogenase E1 component